MLSEVDGSRSYKRVLAEQQMEFDLYNEQVNDKKDRVYLYLGDDLGFVKLWDLTLLIEDKEIEKVDKITKLKTYFYPKRQENKDVSNYCVQLRASLKKNSSLLPPLEDPETAKLLIRESKAHSGMVSSLDKINF
jgi:hypothetical protein